MDTKKTSKFLSLVLRHKPSTIGIELDSNGWVAIPTLLEALANHGHPLSREQLEIVVSTNDKKRFLIDSDRIRANQGHSINIDLNLSPIAPPKILYHGTATRFLNSIFRDGLKKMSRQHVHLSADEITARKVGQRHGKPAILAVDAHRMNNDGIPFFKSENGVWLVDSVKSCYLELL